MTTEVPAGWYPDPHDGSSVRYWSGEAWTSHVTDAATSQPAQTPVEPRPRRRVPLWVALSAGAVGIVLGIVVGSNAASTDTQSVATLESDLAAALVDVENAETALDSAEQTLDDTEAKLETAHADFETERQGLVLQAEEATQAAQAAEARALAAEATATAPLPVAEAAPQPAGPSVYYENCTAARNAGGAPVYVGGPGYGAHLDRDGDGVGCE